MNTHNTTAGAVYDAIDRFAPFYTQCEWDNSGLLIGSRDTPVDKALICLDAGREARGKAVELGCRLIITHHPLIFRPLYSVPDDSAVCSLIRSEIALISAHTNLDKAPKGVNHCLAKALRLENIRPLEGFEFGLMGELTSPMRPRELARHVKNMLGGGCRFNPTDGTISKIAVAGGRMGVDDPGVLLSLGCGALVTGEVKLNEFVSAGDSGLCLIEAGHHETEAVVLEPLAEYLRGQVPGVEFHVFNHYPSACV